MRVTIEALLKTSLQRLIDDYPSTLLSDLPAIQIERTRDPKHGDYASNIAMLLAKPLHTAPKILAEQLITYLPANAQIAKVAIAGPGFINFYLTDHALQTVVTEVLTSDSSYGHHTLGNDKSIIIEFVSANPTGPLHVGHGRHAAYGATLANLLEAVGYKVHREYYINDKGRQMQILAVSIWLRYIELFDQAIIFPSNGYKGNYISDIANQLKTDYQSLFYQPVSAIFNDLPIDETEDGNGDKEAYIDALIARTKSLLGTKNYQIILAFGLQAILADIRNDLEEFGVTFQQWFSEKSLFDNGDINKGLERLSQTDSLYQQAGATWFRATKYGDEKDRVVIRENTEPTYFASDVGYHLNKYARGFDLLLDLFGADHHGYAPRIKAFLQAAGEDPEKLRVILIQFAVLYRGKQKIAMSTRAGSFVTLRELRAEVGNDAARFFYIMRKCDQHLDFDLELAKSRSNENPIYYIQYAYARICSVERQLYTQQIEFDRQLGLANLAQLTTDNEKILLRALAQFPEIIVTAARNYEPQLLATYLQDLAAIFHGYYNAAKFIVPEVTLRNARLCLISAVKIVLANGLKIIGVSTPETM